MTPFYTFMIQVLSPLRGVFCDSAVV